MISVIRALMTAGVWINYRFMRAVFGLPLRLFPIAERTRNKIAGALSTGFWLVLIWTVFLAAALPGWAYLILGPLSVWLFVAVIRMEERRALVRR